MAFAVCVVAGSYGIGGGTVLGPRLVSGGWSVAVVAPPALATTLLASLVGALVYPRLALTTSGSVAPDWSLGRWCGVGGLIGGYVGAWLPPRLPERILLGLLGLLSVGLGQAYVVGAV